MGTVKILTDSTCDLRPDTLKQYNIRMIPLNVHFGDKNFKDGIDLHPERFYQMLKTSAVSPKTSQPSPADFKAVYSELLEGGNEVISIHISSKMSGTVQSAAIAKNELGSSRIHIVDSQFVSIALGLMAIACARAAAAGKTAAEILTLIERMKKETVIYFIVDTLEYLQKGGRIGRASAIIGGLLNIKPILNVKDGLVGPFEKTRGTEKVFKRLGDLLSEFINLNGKDNIDVGLAHSSNPGLLSQFLLKAKGVYDFSGSVITEIGPVVGTHSGPGTLAISFIKKTV